MTYQITLNDQEYTTLAAEAAKIGIHPEQILHDIIQRLQTPTQSNTPVTLREFAEKLYREGKLSHIPTKQPMPPGMLEGLEKRAQRYSGGKPASEMIIEDRGNINGNPLS
jgi:hypothetical protein